jgi:hypothetical protein
MTPRERSLVLAATGLGLAAAALFGSFRLVEARRTAQDAAASLADCRRLAAQITAQPSTAAEATPAGAREPEATEVVRRIEAAAKAGDFPPASIERIEPGPARRVDDGAGPLREKPIEVELRGVTLRQVFAFLHAAGTGRPPLRLAEIRLSAPSPDTGDTWAVRSTLTYLVRGTGEESGGDAE